MSGYQNHFPREFPTDQKCLWGLPELLHFQDVIFFFFPPKAYIPEKGGGTGAEKLDFAHSSVLVCVTLEKWLCFCTAGQEKG